MQIVPSFHLLVLLRFSNPFIYSIASSIHVDNQAANEYKSRVLLHYRTSINFYCRMNLDVGINRVNKKQSDLYITNSALYV